jgi:hypothetical protein
LEVIVAEWKGFGTKLIQTYNYLINNPAVTEFVFVDAYDVIVLGTLNEFEEKLQDRSKMLISVEKNCWPNQNLSSLYPQVDSDWKYINSGSYFSPSKLFIEMVESNPPLFIDDDQLWLTNEFLRKTEDKVLDYNCDVFQSYSFIAEDDFAYNDNRLENLKTGTKPIFVHGNGKTNMDNILDLIK